MKKYKKKNKFIHRNYTNKIFYLMLLINIGVICLCAYTYKLYNDELKLNNKLKNTKEEYINLETSISEYNKIKEDIDLVNGETSDINDKYSKINDEIDLKRNSIDNYTNKIYDLNNKIKKIS